MISLKRVLNTLTPWRRVIDDNFQDISTWSDSVDTSISTLETYTGTPVFNQFITINVADSPYSYTPGSGVQWIKVTIVGGGGGAGGVAATGAGQRANSSGGSGAGAAIKWIKVSSLSWPQTVTVGAGGAGGAAGNNNGSNGSDTTFGAIMTASDGQAGRGMAATSGNALSLSSDPGGGSGGDIGMIGTWGGSGVVIGGIPTYAGYGGGSPFSGSRVHVVTAQDGANGYFPGGGGTGCWNPQNQVVGRAGGSGANGVCWIEEYL